VLEGERAQRAGRTDAPSPASAIVAPVSRSGADPYTLEQSDANGRTAGTDRTTWRTVWLVNPSSDQVGAKMSVGACAADDHVPTHGSAVVSPCAPTG